MTKEKLLELVARYERVYLAAGEGQKDELLAFAEGYDRWMVKEFLPAFAKMATWKGGRLVADKDSVSVINRATGLVASKVIERVTAPAAAWTVEHFAAFYVIGLRLFGLNQQMNDLVAPSSLKLRPDDKAVVKTAIAAETYTWKENLGHHTREVARKLQNAMFTGATIEELGAQLTCPDGHILGLRYGNSRVSWYEVLRRYAVNRPRTLAAMALRRRAMEYARTLEG